jgi:hypothetical protein
MGRMEMITCKVKVQGEDVNCGEFYIFPNFTQRTLSHILKMFLIEVTGNHGDAEITEEDTSEKHRNAHVRIMCSNYSFFHFPMLHPIHIAR